MQELTLLKTTQQSGGFFESETTPVRFDNGVVNQADDLRSVLDHVQNYMRNENENSLDVIHSKLQEMPLILRPFVKSKIIREHERLMIQDMKDFFSRKADVLNFMFSVQKQAMELDAKNAIALQTLRYEKYLKEMTIVAETEVAARVVKLQAYLTGVVGVEMKKASNELDQTRDEHVKEYLRQEAQAKAIESSPFLHEQYVTSIREHSEFVFRVIKSLQTKFEKSLSITLEEAEKVFRA
jgi:hypothetical protein